MRYKMNKHCKTALKAPKKPKVPFYVKVSKKRFKPHFGLKNPSPRMLQAFLFTHAWSRGGKQPLSHYKWHGRYKGKNVWNPELKKFLSRVLGLKHKQVVEYLNRMRDRGHIIAHEGMHTKGKREWTVTKLWLNPASCLTPKKGEKYFILNLRGCGRKGFDILSYIEKTFLKDCHPTKTNPDQLRFKNISKRTRRYRKARHKRLFKGRQKTTPNRYDNPSSFSLVREKENKTAHSCFQQSGPGEFFSNFYQGLLSLDGVLVPWHAVKVQGISDEVRAKFFVHAEDPILLHRGKLYHWVGPRTYSSKRPKTQDAVHRSEFEEVRAYRQGRHPPKTNTWTQGRSNTPSFTQRHKHFQSKISQAFRFNDGLQRRW